MLIEYPPSIRLNMNMNMDMINEFKYEYTKTHYELDPFSSLIKIVQYLIVSSIHHHVSIKTYALVRIGSRHYKIIVPLILISLIYILTVVRRILTAGHRKPPNEKIKC